jgi:hypothetical protein
MNEEWGFFIDLEFDPNKNNITREKINNRNKYKYLKENALDVIYEEEIWHTRDYDYDYENDYENDYYSKNETDKINNCDIQHSTTTYVVYCVICASIISCTIILL